MKILVWGINYAPEVTGIAPCNKSLCEWLKRRGHSPSMLTTFAYYPEWKKAPEDASRLYRNDIINDVPIHRCWHYVPLKVTSLRRVCHEASFVVTSFARALTLPKPQIIVVVSPPLLLGLAARIISSIKNVPYVFHVQDLQPDAALDLGMLKSKLLAKILFYFEKIAYCGASRVSAISHSMLKRVQSKGIPSHKLVYYPNVLTLCPSSPSPIKGNFRKRNGISPDIFLAVYSGNLGVKQGLDPLLIAASKMDSRRFKLVICGDGARKSALSRLDPDNKILFLPLQPEDLYREMLFDADICVVTQQKGTGELFFPSKVLRLMAESRPILAVADPGGELQTCVTESNGGWCLPPNDPSVIENKLYELIQERDNLSAIGINGREYIRQYDSDAVHIEFEKVLNQITLSHKTR